jgi:hypothetical protein
MSICGVNAHGEWRRAHRVPRILETASIWKKGWIFTPIFGKIQSLYSNRRLILMKRFSIRRLAAQCSWHLVCWPVFYSLAAESGPARQTAIPLESLDLSHMVQDWINPCEQVGQWPSVIDRRSALRLRLERTPSAYWRWKWAARRIVSKRKSASMTKWAFGLGGIPGMLDKKRSTQRRPQRGTAPATGPG